MLDACKFITTLCQLRVYNVFTVKFRNHKFTKSITSTFSRMYSGQGAKYIFGYEHFEYPLSTKIYQKKYKYCFIFFKNPFQIFAFDRFFLEKKNTRI